MVTAQNQTGVAQLIAVVQDPADPRLPAEAREALAVLEQISDRIAEVNRQVREWHRGHAESRRLADIPGDGSLTATALMAALGDGRQFQSGRQFAAFLGLVPRQMGTGGRLQLGRISKRGNPFLRTNLVHGAPAALFWRLRRDGTEAPELRERIATESVNLFAVAMANRNARIAWAMVRRDAPYQSGMAAVPAA